jgi:hypothetical protein
MILDVLAVGTDPHAVLDLLDHLGTAFWTIH